MILNDVTKRYGNTVALDRISLDLRDGEIAAVLGESGAGKTTLLNVIAGLTAYEGNVDGETGKKPKRRGRISYLFQTEQLLPHMTAEGNLRFVLPKSEWGKIGDMLAKVGLEGKEKRYPRELSGGERQRVSIARAFLYPHDLLLMDEPFSSLDLCLKRSLSELVVSLWKESRETVVFVTHDPHEAAFLASRTIVLRKGAIAYDRTTEESYPRDFFARTPMEEALVRVLTDTDEANL